MTIARIEDAIEAISRGQMVIVVDDEDRENEGDVIAASDSITPQQIAFMMNHARGLICVAMPGERLDALDIPLMVSRNTESSRQRSPSRWTIFRAPRQAFPPPTGQRPCARWYRRIHAPKTSPAPAISSRCAPTRKAFSAAPVIPKRPSIFAVLRANSPAAPSAKSPMTTAPWPACPRLEVFAERHGLLVVTIKDLVSYLKGEVVEDVVQKQVA